MDIEDFKTDDLINELLKVVDELYSRGITKTMIIKTISFDKRKMNVLTLYRFWSNGFKYKLRWLGLK